MQRRSFLKRLGVGAAIAPAVVEIAKSAPIVPQVAPPTYKPRFTTANFVKMVETDKPTETNPVLMCVDGTVTGIQVEPGGMKLDLYAMRLLDGIEEEHPITIAGIATGMKIQAGDLLYMRSREKGSAQITVELF